MNDNCQQNKFFVSLKNRKIKARKIESVLKDFWHKEVIENLNILDVGCGIGQISEYSAGKNRVHCVDVDDRLDMEDRNTVAFTLLTSSNFPFEDNSFDIAITNHVMEHIKEQENHLSEIHRVLKPAGVCYIAMPNKNFLIEPHYKIPLIHYLPYPMFHGVLSVLGKYKEDLFLLSYGQMLKLFQEQKFEVTEYTSKVIKEPERFNLDFMFTKFIPGFLWEMTKPFSPTNIFILQKTL